MQDTLRDIDGPTTTLAPGAGTVIAWTLPEFGGQPIGEIGFAIKGTGKRSEGELLVDYLRWDGGPSMTLKRPAADSDFWRLAWVNGVDFYSKRFPPSFRISQNRGEGIIAHGTREWTDYKVSTDVVFHLGNYGGLALRVQGLRRYYGVRVTRENKLQIVRVRDEDVLVLGEAPFDLQLESRLAFTARVSGNEIVAEVAGITLSATDTTTEALLSGGIGLFVHEGALSADTLTIIP